MKKTFLPYISSSRRALLNDLKEYKYKLINERGFFISEIKNLLILREGRYVKKNSLKLVKVEQVMPSTYYKSNTDYLISLELGRKTRGSKSFVVDFFHLATPNTLFESNLRDHSTYKGMLHLVCVHNYRLEAFYNKLRYFI